MKRTLSLLVAISMAISLAGCGGSASSSNGVSSSAQEETNKEDYLKLDQQTNTNHMQQASMEGTSATERIIDETKSREIVVGSPTEPDNFVSWDTTIGYDNDDSLMTHNVYEGAFKLMKDGSLTNLLATGYEWKDDGLILEVTFRDDVYFSNGDKMTADDVVFSWNLEGPASKSIWANYDYTEKLDDYKVAIHLKSPTVYLLACALAGRYGHIYNKAYYEKVGLEGYQAAPVGTGAYMMTGRKEHDSMTFEINPNYWGEKPFYEKITLKFLSDQNTQMVALESGDVDVMCNADFSHLLKLDKSRGLDFETALMSGSLNVVFNSAGCLTKDENIRKAVQHAINRQDINLAIFDGYSETTDVWGCPYFTGYPQPGTYTPVPDTDIEKAKEFLKAAGYNGESLVIICQQGKKAESAAQVIQGALIGIGMDVEVKALDSASLSAALKTNNMWDLQVKDCTCTSMDMQFIQQYVSYDWTLANTNRDASTIAYAPNEEITRLLTETMSSIDNEYRAEKFAELYSLLNEQALFEALVYEFNCAGYNTKVQGVASRPIAGLYYFSEWY